MAGLITGDEVRVRIDLAEGFIVAVFPPHGDPDFERAKKELLDSRWTMTRRGRTENHTVQARIRFFDAQCQKIEGWQHRQDGQLVDAMTLPDWKQRFPTELKVSVVGQNFEERETLNEEDRESLPTASAGA